MWEYEKRLQYPVRISKPNPKLAKLIITQYGGADGELGASLRYLSQRFAMPCDFAKGLLNDVGLSLTILHLYKKQWDIKHKHPYIPLTKRLHNL